MDPKHALKAGTASLNAADHIRPLTSSFRGQERCWLGGLYGRRDTSAGEVFHLNVNLANALEIDAQAKRRLADEYDAAQERGEVKANGGDRVSTVSRRNSAPAAADIGLRRDQIHEAREIRDAEDADPGIGLTHMEIRDRRADGQRRSPPDRR